MTGQFPDMVKYEGETYDLVGVRGSDLFTPQDVGLEPFFTTTACWRGYLLTFVCNDHELVLESMQVNIREPISINGIRPKKDGDFFKYTYDSLHMKVPFTGAILIAKDFIDAMYVHMGFQRPIAYRTVLEIVVEKGNILEVRNLSSTMERRRIENPSKGAYPDDPANPSGWIEKTFSLNYDPDI